MHALGFRTPSDLIGPARICLIVVGAVVVWAFRVQASPGGRPDVLIGRMARYNHLLGGSWSCSTSVPPIDGHPAHTDRSTATFRIAPGNVIHNHVSGDDYSGDFYTGYDARAKQYWQTAADSIGAHGFISSTDAVTYTGTSSIGALTVQDRITHARVGQNEVTAHEVLSGASSQTVFDTICTR